MKYKGLITKIIIVVCILLFFVFIGKLVFNSLKYGEGISGIRKELSFKYSKIECITDECTGVFAYLDNKKILFNQDGKKLTTFTNLNEKVIDNSDEYYISFDDEYYYIKNFDNEVIYETKNEIKKINDYLVLISDDKVYNTSGEVLFDNIDSVNLYYGDKYIVIKRDNKYDILNKKGQVIFSNYNIEEIIKNEYDEEKAFIIKNLNNNLYNYYKIDDDKIIGNSFSSYKIENNNYIIKNNNKEYILKINGSQVLLDDNKELLKENVHVLIDDNNTKVLNSDNEIVINISNDIQLLLSDNHYVYEMDNSIYFYNINTGKTYNYNLENSERLISKPFRKTVFIYNEEEKILKLINFKGSKIDKISLDEEPIIRFNIYEKNAYIIVKHNDDYGMYIAN